MKDQDERINRRQRARRMYGRAWPVKYGIVRSRSKLS